MSKQASFYTQLFVKRLNILLQTNTKIQYILDNLIGLIVHNKAKMFTKNNKNVILQKVSKINNDILQIFKLSIFIHRCIIQMNVIQNKFIIDKLIESCQKKCSQIKNTELDLNSYQFFKNKIILPYLSYLQRRSCYQIKKKSKDRKQQQIFQLSVDYNISNIKQQCEPQIDEDCLQRCVEKSYHIINLLNKALYMNKEMVVMIRYYAKRFAWIEDFNIIIGMDIGFLYGRLTEIVEEICKLCQKKRQRLTIDDQNEIQKLININVLFKEIEKINQELQIIYNNYYRKTKVSKYEPQLINTQKYEFLQKTQSSVSPQKKRNFLLNASQNRLQSSKNSSYKVQQTLRQGRLITQPNQSISSKWKSQTDISREWTNRTMRKQKYRIQPQQCEQIQNDNNGNEKNDANKQQNIKILAEMIQISKMFLERRNTDNSY